MTYWLAQTTVIDLVADSSHRGACIVPAACQNGAGTRDIEL
jgi:hypothetical protein